MYFPNGIAAILGLLDFKDMVPTAPFQIGLVPGEADQLQPTEIKGGKCVFNAGTEKGFCIPNTAKVKGVADHGTVVFRDDSSQSDYSLLYAFSRNFCVLTMTRL